MICACPSNGHHNCCAPCRGRSCCFNPSNYSLATWESMGLVRALANSLTTSGRTGQDRSGRIALASVDIRRRKENHININRTDVKRICPLFARRLMPHIPTCHKEYHNGCRYEQLPRLHFLQRGTELVHIESCPNISRFD